MTTLLRFGGTAMHALYLVSVWLHILAATAWIGAMFFLMFVVVPLLRRGDRAQGAAFLSASGPRLRNMGWVAFVVLVVTGTFNLSQRGVTLADFTRPEWTMSAYGRVIMAKLALFAAVVATSAFHDFWIGPRASDAVAHDPNSPASQKLRKTASWMGRANALLALALVAAAVMIVRGVP